MPGTQNYLTQDSADARYQQISSGAWTAFTPSVKFTATPASIQSDSRWTRVGRLIVVNYAFRITNLNGGTGNLSASLPVSPRLITDPANSSFANTIGTGGLLDVSAAATYTFHMTFVPSTFDAVNWRSNASPSVLLTHAAPVTVAAGGNAVGDEVYATIMYEAAT